MTGKTHMAGGAAAALAVAGYTSYDPLLLTAAGIFGSLVPDICHGGSKIGRKAPVLSKLINIWFGHRTFTHSLLFLFLVQVILTSLVPYPAVRTGFLAGIASHLLLDAGTKKGIKLFYPLDITFRFPVTIRTGGTFENGILTMLIIIALYFGREIMT